MHHIILIEHKPRLIYQTLSLWTRSPTKRKIVLNEPYISKLCTKNITKAGTCQFYTIQNVLKCIPLIIYDVFHSKIRTCSLEKEIEKAKEEAKTVRLL